MERFKKIIGFVPQSDATVIMDLNVIETLTMSANTRLPKRMTEFQRLKVVEETLDMLDLSAHRYTPIGRLSGGQQRRLSLGVDVDVARAERAPHHRRDQIGRCRGGEAAVLPGVPLHGRTDC